MLNLYLLIHIGEVSGDYQTPKCIHAKNIWRISEDGELRKTFGHIEAVFEMPESLFFDNYAKDFNPSNPKNASYLHEVEDVYSQLFAKIPELPFSHIWIAKTLAPMLPHDSVVHFAILNCLRSWNFFKIDSSIRTMCNVGGFGIDGCTSSLIGASLVHKDKIYYLFTGDLAFFYDLNAIGNRHIGGNVRIILINTGNGAEFLHFQSPKYEVGVEPFIAAEGHFGNSSSSFVKGMADSLGFDYYAIKNKTEFEKIKPLIVNENVSERPLFVEIFTTADDQSTAWEQISKLEEASMQESLKSTITSVKHSSFGNKLKKILK